MSDERLSAYDAATPVGHEPREGVEPRVRTARPGSGLDAVYASRYARLEHVKVRDGLVVEVELAQGDDEVTLPPAESARVEAAIADETPPEARRKPRTT